MATMKDLAALLGVEIGEAFELQKRSDNEDIGTYKVTEDDIKYRSTNGEWYSAILNGVVENICTGRYRIIKKPWKPREGDYYCFFDFGDRERVTKAAWQGSIADLALYAIGNCFYSTAEAKAHRDEVIASLKSTYEDGIGSGIETSINMLREFCRSNTNCENCQFADGPNCKLKNPSQWDM